MNIIVLGAGTFGTAIANELSVNTQNKVILFSRNEKKVWEINDFHTNKSCFPNKRLSESLNASSNDNIMNNADVIFIAVPSNSIIQSLSKHKDNFNPKTLFVNLSKGFLKGGKIIVEELKKNLNSNNIVSLKGPSFAVEVMEHADTLLTLGHANKSQYDIVSTIIKNTSLYVDSTNDIKGVEILSVLKNVYALVLGIVDAKFNSPNTRFMILTKAFSEIRVFLSILGGKDDTLFLACGFGDLCMTSLHDLSRNRTLGLLVGKGFFNSDYKSNAVILEGLNSIKILHDLLDENQMKRLPIFSKVYSYFTNPDDSKIEFYYSEFIDYNK